MSAEDFARFSYFSDLAQNNLTVRIIIWSQVDRTAARLFLICLTVEERPFQSWDTTKGQKRHKIHFKND